MVTAAERARKRRAEEAQRIQRRTDAWGLRCEGWSQERIARALKVSQSTISRDLKWSADRAISDLTEAVRQTKIEHVFQLERIVDEALQAWAASKQAGKSVAKKSRGKGKFGAEEILTRVEDKTGDVRYLSTAMSAMADIRKILGADAPLKAEISGPKGGALEVKQAGNEPQRIAEILGILAEVGAIPAGSG